MKQNALLIYTYTNSRMCRYLKTNSHTGSHYKISFQWEPYCRVQSRGPLPLKSNFPKWKLCCGNNARASHAGERTRKILRTDRKLKQNEIHVSMNCCFWLLIQFYFSVFYLYYHSLFFSLCPIYEPVSFRFYTKIGEVLPKIICLISVTVQ